MLRITLAQLNPTLGDIEGVVVFSELSPAGYCPGDLLGTPGFLDRVDRALDQLRRDSAALPALCWVVGAPARATPHANANASPPAAAGTPAQPAAAITATAADAPDAGGALHDSLLVLQAGEVRLACAKQVLPAQGDFDERRHFRPGPADAPRVLRLGRLRVGFLVGEEALAPRPRPRAPAWPTPRPTRCCTSAPPAAT